MRLYFNATDRLKRSLAVSVTLLSEIIKLSAQLYKKDIQELTGGVHEIEKYVKEILVMLKNMGQLEDALRRPDNKDVDALAKLKSARGKLSKLIAEFYKFSRRYADKYMFALNKFEKINFNLQTMLYREATSYRHLTYKEEQRLTKLIKANAHRAAKNIPEGIQLKGMPKKALTYEEQEAVRQYTIALFQRLNNIWYAIQHLADSMFLWNKSLTRHVLNLDTLVRERSLRSNFSIGKWFRRKGIELGHVEDQIKDLEAIALKGEIDMDKVSDDNIHKVIALYEHKTGLIHDEIHREVILLKRLNDISKVANERIIPLKDIKLEGHDGKLLRHAWEKLDELMKETHHSFEKMEHMSLHNKLDIHKIGSDIQGFLDERKIPHAYNTASKQPHIKKEAEITDITQLTNSRPHTTKRAA